jgi:hypothetical protein
MAPAALLLWAAGASAQQIEVSLTLAYTSYVIGEPVVVQLEAVNATRDLIDAGGPESKDEVLVEFTKGDRHNELSPYNPAPVAGVFQLKPGQTLTRKIELDKWFQLTSEGRYAVRAVVVHDGMRYESTKKSFDVVPGIALRSAVQMFVKRPDAKRLFRLVYWSRSQSERLFLRIEDDPEGKVWDSLDLGVLLRLSEPKVDISPDGEVTVVHRATQDAFIRTVLWSLPDSVEVVERNTLLDPEISASQRVKALYGEMADDKKEEKKPWWKFW